MHAFRTMLPIRSRTGFANPGRSAPSLSTIKSLIGLPENPPALPVEVVLQVSGQELRYTVDTKYRTVDTLPSEVPRPLVIAPPVFANVANYVLVFPTNESKTVSVHVTAATGPVKGELKLACTAGMAKSLRRLSRST